MSTCRHNMCGRFELDCLDVATVMVLCNTVCESLQWESGGRDEGLLSPSLRGGFLEVYVAWLLGCSRDLLSLRNNISSDLYFVGTSVCESDSANNTERVSMLTYRYYLVDLSIYRSMIEW